MKSVLSYLLAFSICFTQIHAQETEEEEEEDFEKPVVTEQTGKAAKYGTVDGTSMSMAIWGIILTIVIAVTAASIKTSHS